MDFWQQLAAIIIAPSAVVTAVAFLIRQYFAASFNRDLESFKSELGTKAFEYQKRFSLIHDRQAEVVAGIYSRLVRAQRLLARLVGMLQPGGQSLIQKQTDVLAAFNVADEFFAENRIYFEESTAAQIDDVLRKMQDAYFKFDSSQFGNDQYKPDPSGLWKEAFEISRDAIPPLLKDLRREFKILLGYLDVKPQC